MHFLWLLLALACLGYYILCAAYAGIGSSFIFIWLVGTVFFGTIFGVRIFAIKGIITVPIWLSRAVIILIIAGVVTFAVVEGLIIKSMVTTVQADCEYVIVLGCQVRGRRITKSLKKRLDKAVEYVGMAQEQGERAGKGTIKIIVSGGQGNGEDISEAQAMNDYLIEQGMSPEQIIMEDKSTNTEQNFRFSMQYIEDTNAKIGIVTNNFHVYRAKKLAAAKGLTNIVGIPAPSDDRLFVNYMVREAIGVVKDFMMGNM